MSDTNAKSGSNGGIGLFGCIFTVFLCLKLGEVGAVAGWSWWWICTPLLIPLGLLMIVLLIIAIAGYCGRYGSDCIPKDDLPKKLSKKELSKENVKLTGCLDNRIDAVKHLTKEKDLLDGYLDERIAELKDSKQQAHAAVVLLQESVEEAASLRRQLSNMDALHKRLLTEQRNGHRQKLENMQRERVRNALNQVELERAMLEDEASANAEYGPFELQGADLEHATCNSLNTVICRTLELRRKGSNGDNDS